MEITGFTQKILSLSQYVEALSQRSQKLCPEEQQDLLSEVLEELQVSLEELRVSNEELSEQHEELITTREAVEAERQRYQDLFEFAPDSYLVTTAEGSIREANRAAAKLLNLSQSFLVGKPLITFISEAQRRDFRNLLTQLRQVDKIQEWEVSLLPRQSKPLTGSLTVAAVRDRNGQVTALRWLLRDISERKQNEENIRQLNAELEQRVLERTAELVTANQLKDEALLGEQVARAEAEHRAAELTAMIQSLPDVVYMGTQAGITVCNTLGLEVLGCKSTKDFQSLAEQLQTRCAATGRRIPLEEEPFILALQGQACVRELILRNFQSGRDLFVRCASAPIYYNGKSIGAVAVNTDITERKRLEEELALLLFLEQAARSEAETANRTKDEFLAVISHELRTPLNAILGWAQLLSRGRLNQGSMERAIETIERNARSQKHLIEDLLDLSRIVRGKLRLHLCSFNPISTIMTAIEAMAPAAEAKMIQLVSTLDPTLDLIVGDPDRLQQIVWNLLSNAIKFTSPGGRVEVQLARNDSQLQLRISDTGQGISPDFLPYIFDSFRQAEATSKRLHGGLGLGLAIVRHLVELHGGVVHVESPGPGQGATFFVNLPLRTALDNEALSETT